MSVLSTVAFRMVTQEGPRKCLKIYEELKKSGGEKVATSLTTSTTTTIPDMRDAKSSTNSRSARRRIRRRKLQESRRGEIEMRRGGGQDTKESRESGNDDDDNHDNVDMAPYNLVTHANKRTGRDFLERSLMAVFLLRCLQRVGFFAHPTPDDGTYHRFYPHKGSPLFPSSPPPPLLGLYLTWI